MGARVEGAVGWEAAPGPGAAAGWGEVAAAMPMGMGGLEAMGGLGGMPEGEAGLAAPGGGPLGRGAEGLLGRGSAEDAVVYSVPLLS